MSNANNHFAPKPAKLSGIKRNTTSLICVNALAGVPEWVRNACGERVLAEARRVAKIDLELIEDLDCFIPHTTMTSFLDTVARVGGVPDLGLLLAPGLSIRSYGKWSSYVLGGTTLGVSIRRAQNSIGFHSHGDRVTLSMDGDIAHFEYSSSARGLVGYNHVAVGALGVMLSLCRYYLAKTWQPIRIELDIGEPLSGTRAFEDCFQCPVIFGKTRLAIVLERAALDTRRTTNFSAPMTTIEDLARARHEPNERESLPGAIRSQIRTQVLAGSVSIELTALALNLSVRTLQRELNQAGSSYRTLVSRLRFERALELLREGNLNISQIAAHLSYSNSAHFARAFRRESGLPPNEFRMLFGARAGLVGESTMQKIQIHETADIGNRKSELDQK